VKQIKQMGSVVFHSGELRGGTPSPRMQECKGDIGSHVACLTPQEIVDALVTQDFRG
jgi:hypothetical protein